MANVQKFPTTPDALEAIAEDLELFTMSQVASDYDATNQAMAQFVKRHDIPVPTHRQRQLNRLDFIRTHLKDGYTHAEVRDLLCLKQQEYASLVARLDRSENPTPKPKTGTRTTPFSVVAKKQVLASRLQFALRQTNSEITDVAFAAGISHTTLINMLEAKGSMLNNGNTILGVALALNVEVDWLLDNTPKRTKTDHPNTRSRAGAKYMEAPSV
jgi:hypothetical protein